MRLAASMFVLLALGGCASAGRVRAISDSGNLRFNFDRGGKAVPVEWNNTLGSVQVDGVGGVGRFVRTGPGAINLVILEDAYPGTYALAGDRLILRVAVHGDTLRFTLRRAAPRKP